MTERKPVGMSFETVVDRQIRAAQERGDFDNLPGRGKPLAGLDQPYDEMWWVKNLMARKQVSVLPPALEVKRKVERGLERAMNLESEASLRKLVKLLNIKVAEMNRYTTEGTTEGPPTSLASLDADRIVARRQHQHRTKR